ncbi:MAG: SCP2 sterol-binding domain-containing protein [Myxococcales bacterium]|jgi:hypothetical protein
MEPKQILEQALVARLAARPVHRELGGPIVFRVLGEGGGCWSLHGCEPRITAGEAEKPRMRVTVTAQDLEAIWTGRLDPRVALYSGKIQFEPWSLELALALERLLRP